MKQYRLAVVAALAVVAFSVVGAGGAPAGAIDAACARAKVVFYTTDTQNLARALGANPSDCADYFISISPITAAPAAGEPRGGAALTVVHAQGSSFHALAELQPKQWSAYAAANGWYATGVKLHDDMLAAGYAPGRGDTWAVNEIGAPSDSPVSTDVLDGANGGRENFRLFVQGLYAGSGGPVLPGLVFAADEPQLSPVVPDYAQKLASWYADAPFWEDMQRYVSTWAQETYADGRAWAVPGSPLAERTHYLDDYFLHGLRVAEEGNDATAAARTFLDAAYTPLANASYAYAAPDPVTRRGFGETDVLGLTGIQAFVSAQTFALRSAFGTRLGFAVAPTAPPKTTAADRIAVEARVAAAIHDSQLDPLGACTAPGESCDFDLDGAAVADSWKQLANTKEGSAVSVQVGPGVSVTFSVVGARGATWFSSTLTTDAPPGWAAGGPTFTLATTAGTSGPVTVCLGAGAGHVFQRGDDGWRELTTTSPGCGTSDGLGTFALFLDPTPPVVVPHVEGQRGDNGWYVSDVIVSWEVTDPQTAISARDGCDDITVTADTSGTTFTCAATSEGGTSPVVAVEVKRDATPPTLTCRATPSILWAPNGKLVPVDVTVALVDATSGPADYVLADAPADAVDFSVGTPDVTGLLAARRAGNGGDLTYTLSYSGRDAAGNRTGCAAPIVVPHDQGNH